MTATIITHLGPHTPGMSMEEFARTQVTRSSDPDLIAKVIVSRGEQGDTDERNPFPKIVLCDSDEEPTWWLDVGQALAVADRIRELCRDIEHGRPLRRPGWVDEQLREIDQ